jgi:predicted ribosome quality control (RQC) complex YloA/Tae2 family protein
MNYFDLLAWHIENSQNIENCRIDNIYITKGSNNIFLFHLHCKDGDRDLIIEPGRRIHFTKFTIDRDTNGQVSFLRTLLRESFIRSTEILGHERIYSIKTSNEKNIIVELLPRGVLIVTDDKNQILFTTERKEFKDREIKQGSIYSLPPISTSKRKASLPSLLSAPQEIIDALNITDVENGKIIISELEGKIKNGIIEPCLIEKTTVLPIKASNNCIEFRSFNDALDRYFTELEKEQIVNESSKKLNDEKGRLISTINEVNQKISVYKENAERLRKIGKLIMGNYPLIEEIRNTNINSKNTIIIKLDGEEIELDPRLSPTKNASIYFDRAKELEAKAKKAEEILINLQNKLNTLEASIKQKEESSKIKIREKEWYEKYRWTITRNEFLVIAGRDVDQNESLVKKMLDDKDIFLHADIHGAPATIIKTMGKEIGECDLKDAAVISATYSKGWKEGLASIDVFWVTGDQVSKSPPTGEYLPKGSFMIYGKKNFIKNVKLELWIGLEDNNGVRLFVGSEEAVKKRCMFHVKLVPGEDDPEKTASKIIKIMNRENIPGANGLKEEIIKILPGRCKVIKENA